MLAQLLPLAKGFGPAALKVIKALGPTLASNPKLAKQAKEWIEYFADRRRSSSREQRLGAVEKVVDRAEEKVTTPADKEVVERWERQLGQLQINLPLLDFGDYRQRRRRRTSWDEALDALVSEILEHKIRYGDEDDVPDA
jgi:hypothetical protein